MQEVYQETYQNTSQPIVVDKGKKKKKEVVQDKEEIYNLEKVLKTLQSPTKTIPFLSLTHYKMIQQDREKNIEYWKEIVAKFIKQKHNSDISY